MTFSEDQVASLKADLDRTYVQQNQNRDYIPGWYAIQQANDIFGFDGWSYEVRSVDQLRDGTRILFVAMVTVTVGSQVRTDVGTGITGNKQGNDPTADAIETAYKGAVTDGMKRALRSFGDQFGNGLYREAGKGGQRPQNRPQPSQRHTPVSQAERPPPGVIKAPFPLAGGQMGEQLYAFAFKHGWAIIEEHVKRALQLAVECRRAGVSGEAINREFGEIDQDGNLPNSEKWMVAASSMNNLLNAQMAVRDGQGDMPFEQVDKGVPTT